MGNIIKIYITSMKFALFAVFVIGAKATVGDACADDSECSADAGETCDTDLAECVAAADDASDADDSGDDAVKVDADTGMNCSMDGYVGLVQKLMTVALSGMGNWIGYALAAAYFAAEEFNYGDIFCKVMG